MAKTPVRLEVDGLEKREVSMVTYTFTQATDKEGQMAGIPRGGKITLRLKALNDDKKQHELLEWMLDPIKKMKGKIIFTKSTDGSDLKSIEFEDAYCVDYTETWEDQTGEGAAALAHFEDILLSCKIFTNGSAKYENDWF